MKLRLSLHLNRIIRSLNCEKNNNSVGPKVLSFFYASILTDKCEEQSAEGGECGFFTDLNFIKNIYGTSFHFLNVVVFRRFMII